MSNKNKPITDEERKAIRRTAALEAAKTRARNLQRACAEKESDAILNRIVELFESQDKTALAKLGNDITIEQWMTMLERLNGRNQAASSESSIPYDWRVGFLLNVATAAERHELLKKFLDAFAEGLANNWLGAGDIFGKAREKGDGHSANVAALWCAAASLHYSMVEAYLKLDFSDEERTFALVAAALYVTYDGEHCKYECNTEIKVRIFQSILSRGQVTGRLMVRAILHFAWVEQNWPKKGVPVLEQLLSAPGSAVGLTQKNIDEMFERRKLNLTVFAPLLLKAGLNPDYLRDLKN